MWDQSSATRTPQAAREHVSRPLSEDEAALVARGLAEFKDAHRWERLGHKYLPHRCA